MTMRQSKCVHCIAGTVLDYECKNVVGRCYCELDSYDQEIGCNKDCHYYHKKREEKETR